MNSILILLIVFSKSLFTFRYSLKELKDGWYVFIIANAQTSDAGSYSCIATNSLGQASSVGKLTLFRMLFCVN
jgi:hypothetical protein